MEIPLKPKLTDGMGKKIKNIILFVFMFLITFTKISAQIKPFRSSKIITQVKAFIEVNAPASGYSVLSMENDTISHHTFTLINLKPKGFIIFSSDSIKPAWAFSFHHNFEIGRAHV